MQTDRGVDEAGDTLGRRRRLVASAIDAATGLLALAFGVVLSVAWLLPRTDRGREDVASGDAMIAAALIAATLPAWAAWTVLSVRRHAATPGQRRVRLRVAPVEGARAYTRYVRLAVHPLALPLWGWLTLSALLSGLSWLPLLPIVGGGVVALAGVVSLLMLLVRPTLRSVHDRIARTELVPLP